jgi:tRNA(fMet)-specific endonuclease VapC
MRYLLDTNIVSDLVRHPKGRVARRIRQVGDAHVCTSIIVSCELRYGVAKKGAAQLSARLDDALARLDVLAFEATADVAYASIRAALERIGRPIGANDLLIAAHALALGCTMVTDNAGEFSRIEGLACENWLRP